MISSLFSLAIVPFRNVDLFVLFFGIVSVTLAFWVVWRLIKL